MKRGRERDRDRDRARSILVTQANSFAGAGRLGLAEKLNEAAATQGN